MAISKREDVNPKRGTAEYGNVSFADEKNKKYPIDTEAHIRAAWNYINKSKNAGKYSADEVATIKRKIIAAWKDKIDKEGPPSAEGKSGAMISAANKRKMQMIHDTACDLGAECDMTDEGDEVPTAKSIVEALSALKCMVGVNYAASEGWDINNAASALMQVASVASKEASDNEPDDVAQLADVMRGLLKFIGSEIDEMEAAMSDGDGTDDNQPMAAMSGLNFSYIKSLHLPYTEQAFKDSLAVKFIGHDEVTGYSNLWGSEQLADVSAEFFTVKTNFWDDVLGFPRPLTWDHALDHSMKAPPIVGQMLEFGDDEIGRWYHAQLNRKHQYFRAIERLIGDRDLGTSSDSAPQYVEREKAKSGAVWIKTWPLFASALTTTPAEPRMFGTIDYWKSIGVVLPGAEAALKMLRTLPDDLRRDAQDIRLRFGSR